MTSTNESLTKNQPAGGGASLFQAVFEGSSDAYLLIENNIFVECNQAAVRMLQASSKEKVLSTHPSQLSPEFQPDGRSSKEKADDMMQIALELGSNRFEWVHQNVHGENFLVEVSLVPVRLGDRLLIHTTWRDISNRKKAEVALQESRRLLQLVMDNIPQAVFWKDKNLVYLGCNQAFAEDAGLESPQDLIGKTDWDMPWKEQAELYRADDQKVVDEGVTKLNYEEPQTGPTGEVTWLRTSKIPMLDNEGKIFAVLGMYEDITAGKKAEAALQESQRLLQLVMDNIPQAVFWKDPNLAYLGANQAFAEDAGLESPQDLIGKTDWDMPWKEQAELYRADDQRVMDEGVAKLNYEEPQTGPTGEVTWLRTSKVPITGEDGRVFAVLGMYEDITARKQLEQQVQEAFERRGYQVQISTEISQEIAEASELSELFQRVVNLTKERLGYYHTQVLRYDPSQDAVVLIAGYGEIGQKMFVEGHRMPMGTGLIGNAAATGETVMRSHLAKDPDWQPNPFLPDTQGEIAVPIKLGDKVMGVLDVQSDQANVLTEDDRLLLEGLCGQIAIAMEQTRLRQEMEERLQEINNLYRSMSHEGWQTYRETSDLPSGFVYDQIAIRAVEETGLVKELFASAPMVLPGGETLGILSISDDLDNPLSNEDKAFLSQVSEQVALALESARLSEQTQLALAQAERLFDASRQLTQSAGLQELVAATVKTLSISEVNRALLTTFDYDLSGNIEQLTVIANWWNETGHEITPVGTRYPLEVIRAMPMFVSPTPVYFNDTFHDERVDATTMEIVKSLNLRAVAVLPLHTASGQLGALILEAEEPHNFTTDETRLFSSLAPQIATVVENRQQFEKAQHQAEREAMLNTINQKIQSATSVEAVLQIAARELGHALGAPMTIAQLSVKGQN
jgi:PAS domain S-box-containing protein